MLVFGVMYCFGTAVNAPMTHAAETAPVEMATTTNKPMAKAMHERKAMPIADVKTAQEALIKDGAEIKADGMMGKQTHTAIKAFQKKNMLKVTGTLDKETTAELK